jgi:hypothetical protein
LLTFSSCWEGSFTSGVCPPSIFVAATCDCCHFPKRYLGLADYVRWTSSHNGRPA